MIQNTERNSEIQHPERSSKTSVSSPPSEHLTKSRSRLSGGRTWWAHVEFTRIDIELTILTKEIEESLRNEPKTSRVGKCVGYLDLRAFQGERQTGGRDRWYWVPARRYRSWPDERPAHTNAAVRRSSPERVGMTIDRREINP